MIKGSVIQFLLSQVRTSTEALIGGKVYFYQPGTTSTTGIKIWLDEEATSAANNPYTLDADATAQIYASGKYRIVIKDALGVTQFDRDDITFFDFDNPYEIDALQYSPNTFTQASISAALTAIGTTNKATLLLRPGNWIILTALAFPANVTVNMSAGAYFSGAGMALVTFAGNDFVRPEWWGAKTDGTTDCSAAINAAQASGAPLTFSNGVYAISTQVVFGMAGQRISGAGPYGTSGTKIKRLSGAVSPLVIVGGGTGGGVFEGFTFDNNNANADMLKIQTHNLTMRDITCINQTGGGWSLWFYSVNVSNYYNFVAVNMKVTDSLYSSFHDFLLLGGVAGNVLLLDGTVQVQNCNFYDLTMEPSSDTVSLYMKGFVVSCHFYGIKGENNGNLVGDFISIDGDPSNIGSTDAKQISIDGLVFGMSGAYVADGYTYLTVKDAQNIKLSNAYLKDTLSGAGRNYISLSGVDGFSVDNCFTYAAATFNFLKCITVASYNIDIRNINNKFGAAGTINIWGYFVSISNTNMLFACTTECDGLTLMNYAGAINLANVVRASLIECTGVASNQPAGGTAAQIKSGTFISGVVTVAIASATAFDLGDFGDIIHVSGTTAITSIAAAHSVPGRKVTLIFDDILVFTDGNNLKLAGNFTTSADDTITLVCDAASNWYEIARSVN